MKYLLLVSILMTLISCASNERKDVETIASGTNSNTRPFWTFEGDVDMKKLHQEIGDSSTDPKFMLVITKASVKKETLIPNCYSMAKSRASDEIASTVAEVVKSASTMASSSDATEFEKVVSSQTNQFVIGAEIANKTWVKILDDGEAVFHCWTVLKMPRKNLKKLQELVQNQLEKDMGGTPDLKEKVKDAQQKMLAEF